ncbi:MAG: insulinase family protein [Alphaproteobacteria bacterium]|nr:insulinase family protein [Alphaproteobacteria bacterium]
MVKLFATVRRALVALPVAAIAIVAYAGSAGAVTVERVVSKGGIEAWFVRDTSVPLISVEFLFRGGAALEPQDKAGLANLTASLLDEGAGDLDSQAFQERLQNLSIQLHFDADYDTFGGSLKTLNRNRDEAVRLLRLALLQPRFDDAAIERMTGEIVAGIKRRASRPSYLAQRVWQQAVFPNHPYGRPITGSEQTLKNITPADLKGFVKSRLAKDRLLIGVSGDITAAELGQLLDDAFGGLPGKAAANTVPEAEPKALGYTFVLDREVPQSVAIFGLPGLKRDDPDFYAAYVMNHILGGGSFSSWLYEEVREKRGLAYSIYSYLQSRRGASYWMGSVATANAGMAKSVDLIRDQVQKMHDEGVSDEQLENAKLYLNGSFPLRFTSTEKIAAILLHIQFDNLGIDYLDRRTSLIDAVTKEDIARVAKRFLDPGKLTFAVVGQPDGLKGTAKAPDVGTL